MAQKPEMRRTYAQQKLFVIYLVIRCAFTGCLSALYFFLLLILLFFNFLLLLFLFNFIFFVVICCYSLLWGYFLFYYLFFSTGSSTLCDNMAWAWYYLICFALGLVVTHLQALGVGLLEPSLPFLCLWSRRLFLLWCHVFLQCLPSQRLYRQCCQNFLECLPISETPTS